MRRETGPARRPWRGSHEWYLVLAALVLLIVIAAAVLAYSSVAGLRQRRQYASNGERIYFTATSDRGTRITADLRGGMMMGAWGMACVDCHGPQGRGGPVRMMMYSFDAPDIRYQTLISDTGDEGMPHPPYTDETIKRAITAGVDPAGEPLEWPMPRWTMSDQDLDDLLAFIKSLSQE